MNTPRTQIQGFDTTKRSSFNLDYNHAFNAGGFHTLKGGYGFQRTVNDIDKYYPGGYVNIFWDQSFTFSGQTGRGLYGYYEVNDQATTNKAGNNIHSLYVQDQWTVGNRLTVNLGLRAEDEKVPTFRPDFLETAFHFTFADKLAPRLGAAYDVYGDGRMKVFGSWGLYYDWTKYELPRGSFGAETWCVYYRGLNTIDIGSPELEQHARQRPVGEPRRLPRSSRGDRSAVTSTPTSTRCSSRARVRASSFRSIETASSPCTTSTTIFWKRLRMWAS